MDGFLGPINGWLATAADWVRSLAASQDWLGWASPGLEAAPDWAILIPAPALLVLVGLIALGRGRKAAEALVDDAQTGLATATGGRVPMPARPATDRQISDMEARLTARMEEYFASGGTKVAPAPEAIENFAQNVAEDPALSVARDRLLARDFDGATDAVRAVAEREAKARTESAAREAQLWRDLGLLESGRSVAKAIDSYEKARALEPGDFWTLVFLRRLHSAANRGDRALEIAKEARRLVAANADRRDLSVACNELGDVLRARNDLEGALTNYREGLDISRALAAADPTNGERQRDVSVSLDRIGDVLSARNDLEGALTNYREGLDIRRALAAADPTNGERQRDVAVSLERLGQCAALGGNAPEAHKYWMEELSIVATIRSSGDHPGWVRFEAVVRAMMASLRLDDARQQLVMAAAMLRSLKDANRLNPADWPMLDHWEKLLAENAA
jgi:tetratricopeptide (TPR) repeat protein